MPYTGELLRNTPFTFHTPVIFSPWVDRLLIELRRRLKDKAQNAASVCRIAKLLEGHLQALSQVVLESQETRAILDGWCTSNEAKATLMSADTPEELRASAGDFSLMFEKNSAAAHLIDTPTGLYEVDPFDKCAVLALWKFAAAKEAFELVGASPAAIGLAMEGMTCAHLALSIDDGDRERAREMHHLSLTTTQAIGETIETKKKESKAIRGPAAKLGNKRLWDEYKQRALELAKSRPFTSFDKAADFIRPILNQELFRDAGHRSIGKWLREMGWRPTKGNR